MRRSRAYFFVFFFVFFFFEKKTKNFRGAFFFPLFFPSFRKHAAAHTPPQFFSLLLFSLYVLSPLSLTCSGVSMPSVVHTSIPSPRILVTISKTLAHCRGPTCDGPRHAAPMQKRVDPDWAALTAAS